MLLPSLPLWASLLLFVLCAVAIWIAGISLSNYTDVLSERLHLGTALGGLILLAVATNLPELAITITAARNGQVDVAVSNLLGGIAIQTVVLVALDAFGVRVRRPLTYQAASLQLVLEGAAVVAVLAVVVMGAQLPKSAIAFRLTPDVVAIAVVWMVGLLLTQRASKLPWQDNGNPPEAVDSVMTATSCRWVLALYSGSIENRPARRGADALKSEAKLTPTPVPVYWPLRYRQCASVSTTAPPLSALTSTPLHVGLLAPGGTIIATYGWAVPSGTPPVIPGVATLASIGAPGAVTAVSEPPATASANPR